MIVSIGNNLTRPLEYIKMMEAVYISKMAHFKVFVESIVSKFIVG